MGASPESDGRRDAGRRLVLDGLGWLGVAVFTAGTLRAVYVAFLGESLDQVASIGRVMAVGLAAGAVVLWRMARR